MIRRKCRWCGARLKLHRSFFRRMLWQRMTTCRKCGRDQKDGAITATQTFAIPAQGVYYVDGVAVSEQEYGDNQRTVTGG